MVTPEGDIAELDVKGEIFEVEVAELGNNNIFDEGNLYSGIVPWF